MCIRDSIRNDRPIIGYYNVNHSGSGDMYYKGSNMLNTIRSIIHDDELWRSILVGLNETFYHKTVTTKEIENYIIEHSKYDLQSTFDQYLRTTEIPELSYYLDEDRLFYRWTNCLPNFNMPAEISSEASTLYIFPTTEWNYIEINPSEREWKLDENYFAGFKLYRGKTVSYTHLTLPTIRLV